MRHLLNLVAGVTVLASLLILSGCGEKPIDPVEANKGQGQSIEVPSRPGRSEGLGQQQGQ